MAALAPAAPQHRGADPMLGAQLVIQLEQVGRHLGGHARTQARGLVHLLADLRQGGVPPCAYVRAFPREFRALGGEGIAAVFRLFPPFHHVERDLFQVGLAAPERDDLRLEILQLPRRGDLPGVEPALVPHHPGAHLVDVGLRLRLLPLEVALLRLQRGQLVPQLAVPGLEPLAFRDLGQPAPPVIQPAQLGIKVSKFEQPQLRLRGCFHKTSR